MLLFHDLRLGLRVLRNSPGFAAVAVLTLALAIAVNTTVFSWIDVVLLRPIPGARDVERLAVLEQVSSDGQVRQSSHPDLRDLQNQVTLLSGVAASHFVPFTIGLGKNAQRVFGQVVSANFFAVVGIKPVVGRVFLPEEDRDAPGAYPYAVISDKLWRSRFHSNPGVLGSMLRVNGRELTVIGVAPPDFRGTHTGLALDLWVPLSLVQNLGIVDSWTGANRTNAYLDLIARLKPGVSVEQGRAEVQAVARRWAELYPKTHAGVTATLLPLWRAHTGAQALLLAPLRILMAVALLVLLIACANVAVLLLAHAVSRQTEFGLRMALGASRLRLTRQLLAEVLLLAGAGTLLGLWLTPWMGESLRYLLPPTDLPATGFTAVDLNGRVLAFTMLICAAATLLSSVVPALYSAHIPVSETLKEGGRSALSGARSHRARSLLVVVEVALAAVGLIGAGLFVRSFRNARAIEAGFDSRNVLAARFYLSSAGYTADQEKQFCQTLRARLETAPGIAAVAYADWTPLRSGGPVDNLEIEGYQPRHGEDINVIRTLVAPGYFSLLRIPLLAGRDFTEHDDTGTARVIIVNETFARRFLRGDPIGRRVRVADGAWATVVGLVKDSKYSSPLEAQNPHSFVPFRQRFASGNENFVLIRAAGNPNEALAALRREVAALDPSPGLFHAMPLDEYLNGALYAQKVAASLLGVLGITALLLAALGLYSVMAYGVSERTHEFGIRMALGARPRDVLAGVLRAGMLLTLAGLVLGIAVALAAQRFVAGMLVRLSAADPLTFAAAAVFLSAVALAASYLPARRATRVEPMSALRRL